MNTDQTKALIERREEHLPLARFLNELFHPDDGYIELRALPGTQRRFIKPDDHERVRRFADQHNQRNIFFGVAARKSGVSGRLNNCSVIRTVFADVDFKDYNSPHDARFRLKQFRSQPSVVVDSGGGLHAYWLLDQPIVLQHAAADLKVLLRRLAIALGADLASAEPARVLRLPSTLNHKYDPAREVRISSAEVYRYALEDFEFLPDIEVKKQDVAASRNRTIILLPREEKVRRAAAYLGKVAPAIQGHHGDHATYKAACIGRDFDLTVEEALQVLRPWNAKCQPPWPEDELVKKVRNAMNYGTRAIGHLLDAVCTSSQTAENEEQHRRFVSDYARRIPAPSINGEIPQIDASQKDLTRQTELAWSAILARNDQNPFLFRHGGLIVRIEHDEKNSVILREVTPDRMRHVLARVASWFSVPMKAGQNPQPAMPPMAIVRDVLATPDPPLPALLRIVETPVFASDGTLHDSAGYHRADKIYYEPSFGLSVNAVPERPTANDIRTARELILEVLRDFPFVGEAERAHAIAFFLLHFVRALIDGPTPLHLIEKPCPGTGASLLVDVLTLPAMGRGIETMTEGREEEEWRKRIT